MNLKENSESAYYVLEKIFDRIVDIDFEENTLKYVKWETDNTVCDLKNTTFVLNDILNYWQNNRLYSEDINEFIHSIEKVREGKTNYENIKLRIVNGKYVSDYYNGKIINAPPHCWVCINFPQNSEETKIADNEDVPAITEQKHHVKILTFGYFDVFVDNKPTLFRNDKSKELLALIVNRKGAYVTAKEAIPLLWKDAALDQQTRARYRKTVMRLRNTLKEYGVEYIIENFRGQIRILPEHVDCDLFNYLKNQSAEKKPFKGKYMVDYSWGENTLASLRNG